MNRLFAAQIAIGILLLLTSFPAVGALHEYNLVIAQEEVAIKDKTGMGMTINGGIPGPTLYFAKGDLARIHVHNKMSVSTSIHWHGLLVPPTMDGVPFITQTPIRPGTTFTYEFPIRQTGTYWYHSHSELQEQRGLYGSIVIADGQEQADRDHVVLLSDWTSESPGSVLRTLKRGSEWYSLEKGSAQSIFGAARAGHLGDYFKRELQRMPPMDIADIAYDYFLSNGMVEALLEAKPGERVRLRIINGSATTYFHVNFSAGSMTIISADGQLVQPVVSDLFLIGVAETYDVLVDIPAEGSYEFRATAHDGSGFTSTWLGTGMKHAARSVPKPNLYEPMMHAGMGSIFSLTPSAVMGMSDAKVEAGAFDQPGMASMMHDAPQGSATMNMQNHSTGQGMMHNMSLPMLDGSAGKVEKSVQSNLEMAKSDGTEKSGHDRHSMQGMGEETTEKVLQPDPPQMKHQKRKVVMSHDGDSAAHRDTQGMGNMDLPEVVDHVGSARPFGQEFGLLEADISSRPNLAAEGGKQRPTTPYALLKSAKPSRLPADAPIREIRLTLDGDMERYTWFINNKPISETDSIRIREGEVVRFIMINRTMMHHPMHLHGHFFRVLNGQGDNAPLKHTVDVGPMATTVIEFYGNEVGDWFFHCHLLYHMKSGMARLVHYQSFEAAPDVTAVRDNLYHDPFYFYGSADVLSNMTEGELTFTNSRWQFNGAWEVGWQSVEDTDWEGLLTGNYHLDRFTSFFGGIDFLGEDSSSEETRGVLGFSYLLPLNVESTVWLDTDGGARFKLEKELQLTPRVALHGEAEYDTHTQWEGKVGMSYLVNKELSVLANYHWEYGFGVGVQLRF